jgi:hypothetical protein
MTDRMNMEFIERADPNYVTFTKEELDAIERDWREHYTPEMLTLEQKWEARDLRFYWIDPSPWYVSPVDWNVYAGVPEPKQPCRRVFRFSLIGGGQIEAVEDWQWFSLSNGEKFLTHHPGPRLTVTAHVGSGVHRFHGKVDGFCYEVQANAVVFSHTPQEVVDRVGRTFVAMGDSAEHFHALLASRTRCATCNRPLSDEVSKLVGVGPDCARTLNIPHSLTAASRRLELRRQILGEEQPT